MRINDGDVFSSSVRGNVRKQNEDSCGVFDVPNGKLYVVCDGMGGHAGGATASKIGVDSIANYFQQAKYPDVKLALADALEYANLQIIDAANEMPSLKGMGTTACVLLIQGDEAWIAHCGDSRIYLYCAEQQWLHRITKDHSYVQGLVDQGIITDAEAESHPNKNRILKALGIKPDCKPTVCEQPILPANGDTFLICSDGLSGMVNDEQLQYVLQQEETILNKGQMMIQLALQAGGLDNITTQLIKISDSPHAHSVFVSQNPKERLVVTSAQSPKPSGSKKPAPKTRPKIFYGMMIVVAVLVVCGVLWTILPKSSDKPSTQQGHSCSGVNDTRKNYNPPIEEPVSEGEEISPISTSDKYKIEFTEIDPITHNKKKYSRSSNIEADIKTAKCCPDKQKNYIFTQWEADRVTHENEQIHNVKFLYKRTIDENAQEISIKQPKKTDTPNKSRVKVEKFKCDVEGNLKDKVETVEDIQWIYTYYEGDVRKETSDYYESKDKVSTLAKNLIQNAPRTMLCKVEWSNHSGDVKGSEDNKSEYDAYLIEKKNKENLDKIESYATEIIAKCDAEMKDKLTEEQKAQIKSDAEAILKLTKAKDVIKAEELKNELSKKLEGYLNAPQQPAKHNHKSGTPANTTNTNQKKGKK